MSNILSLIFDSSKIGTITVFDAPRCICVFFKLTFTTFKHMETNVDDFLAKSASSFYCIACFYELSL